MSSPVSHNTIKETEITKNSIRNFNERIGGKEQNLGVYTPYYSGFIKVDSLKILNILFLGFVKYGLSCHFCM